MRSLGALPGLSKAPGGVCSASTYDTQGGRKSFTDPNGTTHQYLVDFKMREVQDRVTTVAEGIDDDVRRIETTYNGRNRVSFVTSWDHPEVGQGTVVNQVGFEYDEFDLPTDDRQSHDGPVGSGTPTVSYNYSTGANNILRRERITYPNGNAFNYDYDPSSISDALNRPTGISEAYNYNQSVAAYEYAGTGTVAKVGYLGGAFELDYMSANGDPDSGTSLTGYDRFGRTTNILWRDSNGPKVHNYSPFGRVDYPFPDYQPTSGPAAADWTFYFRSQFTDPETGYQNYGYRYFIPSLGRWLSRDPIEERGGINLYGFVGNSEVTNSDYLGRQTLIPGNQPELIDPFSTPTSTPVIDPDPPGTRTPIAKYNVNVLFPDACSGEAMLKMVITSVQAPGRNSHDQNRGFFQNVGAIHMPKGGTQEIVAGTTSLGATPQWNMGIPFEIKCGRAAQSRNIINKLYGTGTAETCCNNVFEGSVSVRYQPQYTGARVGAGVSPFVSTTIDFDYKISVVGPGCTAPEFEEEITYK